MANLEPNKYDLKQCTLTLSDGTGTPETLDIKFDDGTLTSTEQKNIEYILDRGVLDTVREGDQVPCEISWNGRFSAFTASTGNAITPQEFLTNSNGETTLISTGANCEPFAVDVILTREPNCTVGVDSVQDEINTWSDFRYESIAIDYKAGTMSVTGKCNVVRPTATRS